MLETFNDLGYGNFHKSQELDRRLKIGPVQFKIFNYQAVELLCVNGAPSVMFFFDTFEYAKKKM